MKTKTFDAIKSKHEAAKHILEELEGMTLEEQLAYWQRGTDDLRRRQAELRQKQANEPV